MYDFPPARATAASFGALLHALMISALDKPHVSGLFKGNTFDDGKESSALDAVIIINDEGRVTGAWRGESNQIIGIGMAAEKS